MERSAKGNFAISLVLAAVCHCAIAGAGGADGVVSIAVDKFEGLVLDRMPYGDPEGTEDYAKKAEAVFSALQADFALRIESGDLQVGQNGCFGLDERYDTPDARRAAMMRYLRIRDRWLQSGHYGNFMLAGEITSAVANYIHWHVMFSRERKAPVEVAYSDVAKAVGLTINEVCAAHEKVLANEGRACLPLERFTDGKPVVVRSEAWQSYLAQFCMGYVSDDSLGIERLEIFNRIPPKSAVGVGGSPGDGRCGNTITMDMPSLALSYWARVLDYTRAWPYVWPAYVDAHGEYDNESLRENVKERMRAAGVEWCTVSMFAQAPENQNIPLGGLPPLLSDSCASSGVQRLIRSYIPGCEGESKAVKQH